MFIFLILYVVDILLLNGNVVCLMKPSIILHIVLFYPLCCAALYIENHVGGGTNKLMM